MVYILKITTQEIGDEEFITARYKQLVKRTEEGHSIIKRIEMLDSNKEIIKSYYNVDL